MNRRLRLAQRCTIHPTAWSLALGALTLAGLLLFFGRHGNDDAYITFRYADNLLAGNGLVYNVGERTLSTTTPLYALLLAGLGLLWRDLPAVACVASALALVLAAVLLAKLAWDHGQRDVGLVAAMLLALSPLLLLSFGAETCLYVALILAGFYAYDRSLGEPGGRGAGTQARRSRGHLMLAATALAGAAMIRPDGVLAAGTLGAYHLIQRRPLPWQAVALYAGLVCGWYAALALYFGSPIPVTLLAKQQQGQMAISTRFAPGFVALVLEYARLPFYWLHGLLALLGLGRVVTRDRYWLPLLAWTGLYFGAYTLLGVSRYFWYYAPLLPALVVLVAEGASMLARSAWRMALGTRESFRPLAKALAGLLLLLVLLPPIIGLVAVAWRPDPRLVVYREIGQWLMANTPPQASVGVLEVGIIGYYAQRHIVDFAGLVQPDVARQLTASSDYQDSAAWAIRAYQPDYVVLHRTAFDAVAGSDWFSGDYEPLRSFADHRSLWLTVYRRR